MTQVFKVNGQNDRYAQVVSCSSIRGQNVAIWRFSDGVEQRYVGFISGNSWQWQSNAKASADEALESSIEYLDVTRRKLRRRGNGFSLIELIVVVTIIGILAAVASLAYNKVVNNSKTAKAADLVQTLAQAKSLFVSDPKTTTAAITQFNGAQLDDAFAAIAQYVRVNNQEPTSIADLLTLEQMPATGVTIDLGKVDDTAFGGSNSDTAPSVTGYP